MSSPSARVLTCIGHSLIAVFSSADTSPMLSSFCTSRSRSDRDGGAALLIGRLLFVLDVALDRPDLSALLPLRLADIRSVRAPGFAEQTILPKADTLPPHGLAKWLVVSL